jgi:hypothetical protein
MAPSVCKLLGYSEMNCHPLSLTSSNTNTPTARSLIINGEFEGTWKDTAATYFKLLTRHSPGITEENYVTPPGYPVSGQGSVLSITVHDVALRRPMTTNSAVSGVTGVPKELAKWLKTVETGR